MFFDSIPFLTWSERGLMMLTGTKREDEQDHLARESRVESWPTALVTALRPERDLNPAR